MTDLEEEVRDGGKAKQVLENEIFQRAVKTLEEAFLVGIRQSAFKDEKLREKLCQRLALLHDLVGQIQTVMETGQMAAEQIEQKTLAERVKGFLNG